jgi:hypothetical protein
VVSPLEVLVRRHSADQLTAEERRAVAASREYFSQRGQGISFDQLAAECGFTVGEIQGAQPRS